MDAEVALTLTQIGQANSPEQIFGELKGDLEQQRRSLKKYYRRLALVIHPDRVLDPSQRTQAEEATRVLNSMYTSALKQVDIGSYGSGTPIETVAPTPSVVIVSNRKRDYAVGELLESGQICNTYACTFVQGDTAQTGLFKVSRLPSDNDLVKREAEMLKHLAKDSDYSRWQNYLPRLVDSFRYRESGSRATRQANVLTLPVVAPDPQQWYSLEEVRAAYPDGITTADMAWMWRRLLVVLGFTHRAGVIHGAVLPAHIYIHPEGHGLLLTDWSFAVSEPETSGERLSVVSTKYEAWYPQEVWDKARPRPGLDLYLGAKSMMYLLGGDPLTGKLPNSVARKYVAHLRGTALANPTFRPQDAWELLGEFDELLGKRHFRPFSMPEKSSGRTAN